MQPKYRWWSGLVAAVQVGLVGVTAVAAAGTCGEQEMVAAKYVQEKGITPRACPQSRGPCGMSRDVLQM
jgi:hypothetical protein